MNENKAPESFTSFLVAKLQDAEKTLQDMSHEAYLAENKSVPRIAIWLLRWTLEKKQLPVDDQDKESPLCDWIVLTRKQDSETITVSIPSETNDDDEENEDDEEDGEDDDTDWIRSG